MNAENKEYASNAKANTGVALGAVGTGLYLLQNGLGGVVGGGANPQVQAAMAEKDSEIARLKAEKYSDNAAKEESNRLLQNYLKPYGDAIAAGQVREAKMQAEIDCLKQTTELKFQLLQKDVALVRQDLTCACTANATAIAQVQAVLGNITKLVVPNGSICPGWGDVKVSVTPTTATTAAA